VFLADVFSFLTASRISAIGVAHLRLAGFVSHGDLPTAFPALYCWYLPAVCCA